MHIRAYKVHHYPVLNAQLSYTDTSPENSPSVRMAKYRSSFSESSRRSMMFSLRPSRSTEFPRGISPYFAAHVAFSVTSITCLFAFPAGLFAVLLAMQIVIVNNISYKNNYLHSILAWQRNSF